MERGDRLRAWAALIVLAAAVAGCRSTSTAAEPPASAQPTSAAAPSASSVSSLPPIPAEGEYLCKDGVALCNDRIGPADDTADVDAPGVRILVAGSEEVTPFYPTLALATHTVYYQEGYETNSRPMTYTLKSVSTDGGPSKVLVKVWPSVGNEGATMGAPQVSADGRYLAYAITISLFGEDRTPTPAQLRGIPMQLGSRIYIIDLLSPQPIPHAVPAVLPGPALVGVGGYQLAGWSADDKELFYFAGPNRDLDALTFNSAGSAVTTRTLSRGRVNEECPYVIATATTPTGDLLFDANCDPEHPEIDRLHDDHVSGYLPLTDLTDGWIVEDIVVDTTGRFVQLDAQALTVVLPDGTTSRNQCEFGAAHLDFLDGALYSKSIGVSPCPPGHTADPVASPS